MKTAEEAMMASVTRETTDQNDDGDDYVLSPVAYDGFVADLEDSDEPIPELTELFRQTS